MRIGSQGQFDPKVLFDQARVNLGLPRSYWLQEIGEVSGRPAGQKGAGASQGARRPRDAPKKCFAAAGGRGKWGAYR